MESRPLNQRPKPLPNRPSKRPPNSLSSSVFLSLGLVVSIAALFGCLFLSLSLGAADIDGGTVWRSLFQFDESSVDQLIIRTDRKSTRLNSSH